MLTREDWAATPGLRHGFLDAAACRGAPAWEAVVARVGAGLPVVTLRQVHGARVVTAEAADLARAGDASDAARAPRPEADAVATATRGLLVGVVTADCVPALLVDRRARVAAAVHAGWRGAAAGVLETAVAHLRARFGVEPSALEACLGPAIGPCCYRVGVEVREAFARTGSVTAPAWQADGRGLRFDLRLAVRRLLEAAGIAAVETLGPCTACDPGFCSYRRDGEGAGRQLSFIGWA